MEQERIQAFWGKCGLVKIKRGWKFPDGDVLIDADPQVDLNSLFKYAVPLVDKIRLSYSNGCYHVAACKGNPLESASWSYDFDNEDPATALFLALDQVL